MTPTVRHEDGPGGAGGVCVHANLVCGHSAVPVHAGQVGSADGVTLTPHAGYSWQIERVSGFVSGLA